MAADLMPSAGILYDRFGPRWLAARGLALVALGTYLMKDLTLEASNTYFVWLLVLRAVGMGLAMMPIMTGGLSAAPPDRVDGASAFNNVTQRTTAALGLAVLTTLVTKSRAQLDADRGGLLGADTVTPMMGTGPGGQMAGMYALQQQAQTQAFVDAMDGLFIVTAIITALGIPLALMLRSGPASSGGPSVPAAHRGSAGVRERLRLEPAVVGVVVVVRIRLVDGARAVAPGLPALDGDSAPVGCAGRVDDRDGAGEQGDQAQGGEQVGHGVRPVRLRGADDDPAAAVRPGP